MKFTDQLWNKITPIYNAILDMPFIQELTEGTLPQDKFLFYMRQDTLYLADYSKALSLAGIRADRNEHTRQFMDFGTNTISVERELHGEFYEKFDVAEEAQKSPSCFAYTNFLLSTATVKDNAVTIAALLPCFWIYREVGLQIYENSAPDNPYQEWIETYAGEEFNEGVEKAIAITNEVAAEEPQSRRNEMEHAFVRASQLEWMFWDSAYRMEKWSQQPADRIPA